MILIIFTSVAEVGIGPVCIGDSYSCDIAGTRNSYCDFSHKYHSYPCSIPTHEQKLFTKYEDVVVFVGQISVAPQFRLTQMVLLNFRIGPPNTI